MSYGSHGPGRCGDRLGRCTVWRLASLSDHHGAVRATRSRVDWVQGEDRSTYSPWYLHPLGHFPTLLTCGEGDRLYIGTASGNLSVYSITGSEGTYYS